MGIMTGNTKKENMLGRDEFGRFQKGFPHSKGLKRTEENKRKISETLKRLYLEGIVKPPRSMSGKHHTKEAREKISKNHSRHNLGKKWSEGLRERLSGENSSGWLGDKVGYSGVHSWIRKKLGTPSLCQYCKTEKAKKFEWANLSRKYLRKVEDWIRLCTSCHVLYDKGKLKLTGPRGGN